jgi:hypothetical protein
LHTPTQSIFGTQTVGILTGRRMCPKRRQTLRSGPGPGGAASESLPGVSTSTTMSAAATATTATEVSRHPGTAAAAAAALTLKQPPAITRAAAAAGLALRQAQHQRHGSQAAATAAGAATMAGAVTGGGDYRGVTRAMSAAGTWACPSLISSDPGSESINRKRILMQITSGPGGKSSGYPQALRGAIDAAGG